MKRDSILRRRSLLIACLIFVMAVLTCVTGCIGNSGGQTVLEATDEELNSSAELRRIGLQTVNSIQVNTTTAAIGFYYAGETEFIKPEENGSYSDLHYTLTAYDQDGNELKEDKFSFELNDSGIITVNVKEIGRVDIHVESLVTDYSADASVSVIRQALSVFDIIMLGIGLYVLYLGIIGKGQVYDAKYVKEGMESNHKAIIRICCLIISICMIAPAIVAACDGYGEYKIVKTVFFVIAVVIFIAGMIATGNMIDKEARKEAEEKRMSGHDLKAPRAAFEFDDDEPTIDDLKK